MSVNRTTVELKYMTTIIITITVFATVNRTTVELKW